MQFQQNIFLFHRTVTKLPKNVFRIGIAIVILFIIYQTFIMLVNYQSYPFEQTELQQTLLKLYQQKNIYFIKNKQFLIEMKKIANYLKNDTQIDNNNKIDDSKQQSNNNTKQQLQNKGQQQILQKENQNQYENQNDNQKKIKLQALNLVQQNQISQIIKEKIQQFIQQYKLIYYEHIQGLKNLFPQTTFIVFQTTEDISQTTNYEVKQLPQIQSKNKNKNNQNAQEQQQQVQAGQNKFIGVYFDGVFSMPKNKQFQSHGLIKFLIKIKSNVPTYLFSNEEIIQNQQIYVSLSSAVRNVEKIIKQKLKDQFKQIYQNQAALQQIQEKFQSFCQNFNIKKFSFYISQENYLTKLYIPFQQSNSLFLNIFFSLVNFALIYLVSIFIGLFIRYGIVAILTIYMILGGSGNFRWYQQYANILRGRARSTSIKFWLATGMVCSYGLLSYGSWWIISFIYQQIYQFKFQTTYYATQFIKIIFFAQLCHFLFMHSRTTIYFYGLFSTILSVLISTNLMQNAMFHSQFWLTIHILTQILLVLIMLYIQKQIIEEPFHSEYKPTLAKPRMMFYMGYDLTWQKSIPPLWTYLSTWFDWSYVKQKQSVYIDRDYRLLYGMLLGMNQRQALPEDQQGEQAESQNIAPQIQNQSQMIKMKEDQNESRLQP